MTDQLINCRLIDVNAVQLATDQKVKVEDVRLYLDATEAAKEFVGHYFNKKIYFDYTHLVCRTALDGNSYLYLFDVILWIM